MTPHDVLALCRERDVKAVDLRFTDLWGGWHGFTLPVGKLDDEIFEEGRGFDGSRCSGWQNRADSDLLAVPQAETAFIDPLAELPTLVLFCNVLDPITREDYPRDPRGVARRAVAYLKQAGVADRASFGVGAEFSILDGPADQPQAAASATSPELARDTLQALIDAGLDVARCQTASRREPGRFSLRPGALVAIADAVQKQKHIVKGVAARRGRTATFLPQPPAGAPAAGMHLHVALWRQDEPLFAGGGYASLSDTALHALGGILKHAAALCALTNPTTNSFRRLTPGRAPIHLTYGQRNRAAACRIPMDDPSPRSKRIEFQCPDPSCNPYLALAAVLLAVIDGVQNKVNPGHPCDQDLFHSPDGAGAATIPRTPACLESALTALEKDHDFLLRGDVFSADLLAAWIDHKRRHEIAEIRRRPHPHEFILYHDV